MTNLKGYLEKTCVVGAQLALSMFFLNACATPSGTEIRADAALSDSAVLACGSATGNVESLDPTALLSPYDARANACAIERSLARIASAHVVCMGEYLHTIGETYGLRRAFLRSAFARGVVTYVEEAPEANVEAIDIFVRTGDETQLERLRVEDAGTQAAMDEYIEFIRWLRSEYLALPESRRFRVTGIDVAVTVGSTRDSLLSFLRAHNAPSLSAWEARFLGADLLDAAAAADAAMTWLESERQALVAASSEQTVARAVRDARNLAAGYRFNTIYESDFKGADALYREPGLARNLVDLAEHTENLIVVAAHDAHCAAGGVFAGPAGTSPSMGALVSRTLGDNYAAIGVFVGRGSFAYRNGFAWSTFAFVPRAGRLEENLDAMDAASDDAFIVETSLPLLPRGLFRVGAGDEHDLARDFRLVAYVSEGHPTTPWR